MPEQQKVAQDFAMSEFSLILVLQKKQEKPTIDMAKIQIKSERHTPFGGLFSIMEQFDSTLSANSIMRGCVNAIRTFKGLVADLRLMKYSFEVLISVTSLKLTIQQSIFIE